MFLTFFRFKIEIYAFVHGYIYCQFANIRNFLSGSTCEIRSSRVRALAWWSSSFVINNLPQLFTLVQGYARFIRNGSGSGEKRIFSTEEPMEVTAWSVYSNKTCQAISLLTLEMHFFGRFTLSFTRRCKCQCYLHNYLQILNFSVLYIIFQKFNNTINALSLNNLKTKVLISFLNLKIVFTQ